MPSKVYAKMLNPLAINVQIQSSQKLVNRHERLQKSNIFAIEFNYFILSPILLFSQNMIVKAKPWGQSSLT